MLIIEDDQDGSLKNTPKTASFRLPPGAQKKTQRKTTRRARGKRDAGGRIAFWNAIRDSEDVCFGNKKRPPGLGKYYDDEATAMMYDWAPKQGGLEYITKLLTFNSGPDAPSRLSFGAPGHDDERGGDFPPNCAGKNIPCEEREREESRARALRQGRRLYAYQDVERSGLCEQDRRPHTYRLHARDDAGAGVQRAGGRTDERVGSGASRARDRRGADAVRASVSTHTGVD